jgi:hypothetical protein
MSKKKVQKPEVIVEPLPMEPVELKVTDISIYVKESGTEIPVNNYPASIAQAEKLGWKLKK